MRWPRKGEPRSASRRTSSCGWTITLLRPPFYHMQLGTGSSWGGPIIDTPPSPAPPAAAASTGLESQRGPTLLRARGDGHHDAIDRNDGNHHGGDKRDTSSD